MGGTAWEMLIRFTADVLNGVPSIVVGIAAYGLVVLRQGHFSALAGGVALGDDDDPDDHAHHGRNVAAGAVGRARSGVWTGCFAMADDFVHYFADGDFGSHYRDHAGFCTRCGGNCAIVVYRLRQSILELEHESADCGIAVADFHYAISPFDEWHRQAWAGALC